MTFKEAKKIFLNRGYIEVPGGTYYDADKWREAITVISKWLEQNDLDHEIIKAYNEGEAFILDMLRKEVEQIEIDRDDDSLREKSLRENYRLRHNIYCDGCEFIIKRVLEIIDKYKEGFILPLPESEKENDNK